MKTWNCELESQENCLVKEHNNLINQHDDDDYYYDDYDNNNNINGNKAYILRNFCTTCILKGEWQNLYACIFNVLKDEL
jgi:uncharacterized protein YvpB